MKRGWGAVALTMLMTCAKSAPQAIAEPPARSYLGVALTDAPPQLGLQAAMVARVIANSPADQAGLHPGDLIRVVNGHAVASAKAFRYYVVSRNPGDRLIVNVLRGTPAGIALLQLTAILASEPGTAVPQNTVMDLAQQFDQHVINGEVTVQDPTTGTQSDIPMGTQPYYSSDGLGHFYNSSQPNPPAGFHPVQRLP